jgi:hypothetical protein
LRRAQFDIAGRHRATFSAALYARFIALSKVAAAFSTAHPRPTASLVDTIWTIWTDQIVIRKGFTDCEKPIPNDFVVHDWRPSLRIFLPWPVIWLTAVDIWTDVAE